MNLAQRALQRQTGGRAQAAERAAVQRDVAAMRPRDVARDGKAQTRMSLVLIAGFVKSVERTEGLFATLDGMPGPSSSIFTVIIEPSLIAESSMCLP